MDPGLLRKGLILHEGGGGGGKFNRHIFTLLINPLMLKRSSRNCRLDL